MKLGALFDACFSEAEAPAVPTIPVTELASTVRVRDWGGDKFHGGFGSTDVLVLNYWELRARSDQLFKSNLYARGVLRRMVTNVINTGLHLESTPMEKVLGFEEDALADWTEIIEDRFELWASDPKLCHYHGRLTFGQIQATIKLEALVGGDVLVMLEPNAETGLPRVRLINASRVQTPTGYSGDGTRGAPEILHGVELDKDGRHVAYHVHKDEGGTVRVPAIGPRTGRRLAWLVYGTDRRVDAIRGEPLFSLILQSLREIDRYRDSAQRKASLNAVLAMFVTRSDKGPGTGGLVARGAVRRGVETGIDSTNQQRQFKVAEFNPGMVIDELAPGEEPKGFPSTGTDEKFGDFEKAIVSGVAWANGIPPEILTLTFNANYSASQAAINEFKLLLDLERTDFGSDVCQVIFEDWILSEGILGLPEARQPLDAWRDGDRMRLGAWLNADWAGQVKPSTDLLKQAKGASVAIQEGLITRTRAARAFSGMKFAEIVKQLARENEALANANQSLSPATEAPAEEDETEDEEREAV